MFVNTFFFSSLYLPTRPNGNSITKGEISTYIISLCSLEKKNNLNPQNLALSIFVLYTHVAYIKNSRKDDSFVNY